MIDGSTLTGVGVGSGIGTYTENLVNALSERSDVDLGVLSDPSTQLPAHARRIVAHRPASRVVPKPRAHLIEHSIRLPVDVRRHRKDGEVFHNPSFHAPAGIAAPWVQTLHDVIPLVFEAPDQLRLRSRWKRFGPRYRSAGAVVAVSRFSADEGIRLLGLEPDRVHVAHHGVHPSFKPPAERASPEGRPYLLIVGEYSHRKGFPEAFAVIDELADAGYPHQLVVAGRIHRWIADDLSSLHAKARHPDRIELRGLVADLVPLYQQATAYLSTSRYEGFGMPALEAMACATPVVAFSNTAVTEVVGDGGILVPDGDVGSMARAVRVLLDSGVASGEAGDRGLEHARRFTWEASAEVHLEAYKAATSVGARSRRH